jgi:hypothetical protein
MITRLKLSTIEQGLPKYRSMLAGNDAFSPYAFESIATVTLGSDTATITFSSIPNTYQHLQIRALAKNAFTTNRGVSLSRFRFNSDSASNYSYHRLIGDGSTAAASGASSQAYLYCFDTNGFGGSDNSTFSVGVLDIHDYASTSKNKTLRSLSGVNQNSTTASEQSIGLESGAWYSTSAINRIDITSGGGNWKTGSTFALYGIKGA